MPDAPVLLVTGAGRGIGAATARLAAARGYDIAINYLRDATAAESVAEAVRKAGRRALVVQGDMGQEADITRMFDAVDKGLGRLTHLVYNAGIVGVPSRLEAADAAMMRHVIDLNVLGALLCAKAAVHRMSSRHGGKGGAMVMISSGASTIGSPGEYVWYAATKGAIDSMTLGLSKELAEDGIRVNAVAPGIIDTEIHAAGRLDRLVKFVPLQRAGASEEIAEAVLFLLSDASAYTTGAILRVAGGR